MGWVGWVGGVERGQKASENFVTGGEGFVCWILENVTNSGLNVAIVSQKYHTSLRILHITMYHHHARGGIFPFRPDKTLSELTFRILVNANDENF